MQENSSIIDDVQIEEKIDFCFPSLNERVKATAADGFCLILFMLIFGALFDNLENPPESYRKLAFIFIFGLYNPLFISLFGGTLGHLLMGLRVKRYDEQNRNIFIIIAFFRYALKAVLGIISFFTISNNSERRAIHDLLTGSVVIYKK